MIKDIKILGGSRDIGDILIVDNRMENFAFQLENGVLVNPYVGQERDFTLLALEKYLLNIAT